MSMLCKMGGHEAERGETWNAGYYFSRCRRCGTDMIRAGAGWETVPEGHRVSWKKGWHRHSIEPDYRSNLPALCRSGSSLMRWRRSGGAPAEVDPQMIEETQEQPYPYVLALAAIAGAGLQMLMGGGRSASA
jgi:hypothetical protein